MSELNERELKIIVEQVFKNWDDIDEIYGDAKRQIKNLIKIFYAKEISKGRIKKDIPQPDLVKWLQGLNQAATAMKDNYTMKATIQLLEMIANRNEK